MKEKSYCYMIISVRDDLPLGVFNTYAEALGYLGCSSRTFFNMLRHKTQYKGMCAEKILL